MIIPTTGRETLRRAVNSVSSQTLPVSEIIVVLDKPENEQAVRSWIGTAATVLVTEGGLGGSAVRNRGVSASSGELVAFLDDDDWWEPDKNELQCGLLAENPNFQWSYTYSNFVDGKRILKVPRADRIAGQTIASYVAQRPSLRYGDGFVQSSSVLLRRSIAEEFRWNEALPKHQDWDLIVRLTDVSGLEPLVCPRYVVNVEKQDAKAGSVSSTPRWRQSWQWLDTYEVYLCPKAYADFVLAIVVRSGLMAGQLSCLQTLTKLRAVPHFSALLLGATGVIGYAKLRLETLFRSR